MADCTPNPAAGGQTVTCSGTAPSGFTAGTGVNNLTLDVLSGATVRDNGVVSIGLNSGNTVNNNGTVVDSRGTFGITGENNNTISNFNTISVGTAEFAIFTKNQNTISNSGTINVGEDSTAIVGDANDTVSNTGKITLGPGGTAISLFGNGASVINSGVINGAAVTFGIAASGFDSTITNNGTITLGNAKPSPSVGIAVNGSTDVTNNGTISVGKRGDAVLAEGSNNTITNNGAITAGTNGVGIWTGAASGGPNTVVNNGTVDVSGSHGDAILVQRGGSVFNAGTINAPGGTAIDFCRCATGYTLTLAPTSMIDGLVTGSGNTFQLGGSGSGAFDLSTIGAAQQYRGFNTFNVVGGTWSVANTFSQSQTWNVNGGILAGTGTLKSIDVNNGGALEPGTIGVPGTAMTLTHNLALQSGALLIFTLNSTTSTRINVGGSVSLGGTLEVNLLPGNYSSKTVYTLIDPPSISGSFNSTVVLGQPGFTAVSVVTPNGVDVTLKANLGNSGGPLSVNQQNVATSLNNYFNNGGTLPANFSTLFGLTGSSLANGLSQVSGEAAADAEFGAFQMTNQFLNLMLDPFVDGRLGSGVGTVSRQTMAFAPDEAASLPPEIALAYAGVLKAPPQAPFEQRWTAWGASYGGGNWTNGSASIGSSNMSAQTYGVVAGMDYHYSPDTIFGFALGGGATAWGLSGGLGSGRSDAFQTGVYGITRSGPAYLAAALSFANHWITTSRAALGDALTANFAAQSYGARVEGGYRYAVLPTLGVTPYAALQAQDFNTPGYGETDVTGGGFGLSYASMNATDVRSELGSRFDNPEVIGGMPLLLRARVAWAHDWVSNPSLSAAFESLPGTNFTVNGAPMPQNSALTSVGAELYITPRWTFLAKFDGEFAQGSQTYAGSGTLRWRW